MEATTSTPATTVAAAPSHSGPMAGTGAAWRAGARDMLPVLVGLVPFGLAVGHAVDEAVGPEATVVSSLLVFAGAAQLTLAEMLDSGAAAVAVIGAVMLVNARLVLFGGALAPQWKGATGGFRAIASYLLTDPVYVLGMARGERPGTPQEKRAYYLGAGITLWVTWQLVTVASLLIGGGVLPAAHLEFVVPLCMVALLVPAATTAGTRAAAIGAAAAALAVTTLPAGLALPVATVVGVVAGVAAERVVLRSAPVECAGCRP
jgi:predicted branched-subunit amino acid permease